MLIPPANTPERQTFNDSIVGTLDRATGQFLCVSCVPPDTITDPCKVYGVNIAPYSAVCNRCGNLVVDGLRRMDDEPLTILGV